MDTFREVWDHLDRLGNLEDRVNRLELEAGTLNDKYFGATDSSQGVEGRLNAQSRRICGLEKLEARVSQAEERLDTDRFDNQREVYLKLERRINKYSQRIAGLEKAALGVENPKEDDPGASELVLLSLLEWVEQHPELCSAYAVGEEIKGRIGLYDP